METQPPLTYREAGVDIEAADRAVAGIKRLVQSTYTPGVQAGVGGFGAVYKLEPEAQGTLLVAGCDGVGTKLKIAFALGRHNTVGLDLVAMSANDVLTLGAQPIFMLDYIACGKLKPEVTTLIVEGIAEGCKQAGCALIGGEIAEMPGFYPEGEYDLAGFVVGTVQTGRLVDGSDIQPGDRLIGLPSTGLHSNGYSLARKVLLERAGLALDAQPAELDCTLGEELLRPTQVYVKAIQRVLQVALPPGMAHITGGGLPGNLVRILPDNCVAKVDKNALPKRPVFELIQRLGKVSELEMFRTFNMGVGFVLVVHPAEADAVVEALQNTGEVPLALGEISKGAGPSVEIR